MGRSDESITAWVGGTDRGVQDPMVPSPTGAPVAFQRYVVLRELGRGGSGTVVEAYDPQLDRKVAIKLLHARSQGESDPSGAGRLLREAQAMARIDHPNVVAVYDFGTYADGEIGARDGGVFMVMEIIEGETLAEWLAARPRSWQEIRDVFLEAGRGLAAAHALELVHRDFKPRNVLLREAHRPGSRVKVGDFGLARRVTDAITTVPERESSSSHALDTAMTRTGTVLGTPAYMAPEQHVGGITDARSDQYSFALALYEALLGRRPFIGDTLQALRDAKLTGSIQLPTDRNVPRALLDVVLRGLSRNPAARYPDMTAMLVELARDPFRRRRRWLGAAAVLGVVAIVGASWSAAAARRDAECRAVADEIIGIWDAPTRAAVEAGVLAVDRPYAETTWRWMASTIDEHAAAWIDARTGACRAAQDDRQPPQVIAARLACLERQRQDLAARVAVLQVGDREVVDNAGALIGGLEPPVACEDPDRARSAISPAAVPMLARLDALRAAHKLDEALAVADEMREHARAYRDDALLARADIETATIMGWRGDRERARSLLRSAAVLAERAGDADAVVTATVWLAEALLYDDESQAEAEFLLEQANARAEHELLSSDVETDLLWVQAKLRTAQARSEEAEALYRAYVELASVTRGRATTEVIRGRTFLAGAMVNAEDADGAEIELYDALDDIIAVGGEDHYLAAGIHVNLSGVSDARRDPRETLAESDRALDIGTVMGRAEYNVVPIALSNGARALYTLGDHDAALARFEAAVRAREKVMGKRDLVRATLVANVGLMLQAMDRPREALPLLEDATAVRDEMLAAGHPDRVQGQAELALLLVDLGDFDRARREAAAATAEIGANSFAKTRATLAIVDAMVAVAARDPDARTTLIAARDVAREAERDALLARAEVVLETF